MTDPNESKRNEQSSRISSYARYSGIAFQMIAIIVLGTYGGVKLDEVLPNEYSLFTILCSLGAVGLSMYFAVRQVTGYSKKNHREHED